MENTVFGRIAVVLKAHAFSVWFWFLLLLSLSLVLFLLKFLQTGLEDASGADWTTVLDHSVWRRLPNISFILLVTGCVTGFFMIFPVYQLQAAQKVGENIEISRLHVSLIALLSGVMWGLYLQAVIRDGGTFMWPLGDGREATVIASTFPWRIDGQRIVWDTSYIPKTAELDAFGPKFLGSDAANKPALLKFSELKAQRQLDLRKAAAHLPILTTIQIIEGCVFLFVLLLWAFMGVLVNIYISRVGKLGVNDRGSAAASACHQLETICIAPASIFVALTAIGVKANLQEGIASQAMVVITSMAIYAPFLVGLIRAVSLGAAVGFPTLKSLFAMEPVPADGSDK